MSKKENNAFAFEGLDRVLHEKARLGILTSLLAHKTGLGFNELKELCSLTDGNLSRHLQTLSEAGLVDIEKGKSGNRPHTTAILTVSGRKKFLEYLSVLESIVSNAIATAEPKARGNVKLAPA
ncbi:MAG: transcriptional regulator [Gemmataceae bacterium]